MQHHFIRRAIHKKKTKKPYHKQSFIVNTLWQHYETKKQEIIVNANV